MRTVGGTDRGRPREWEVKQRRRRALARLAERRRADEERLARARSMARHPSAGHGGRRDPQLVGIERWERGAPVLEVVPRV